MAAYVFWSLDLSGLHMPQKVTRCKRTSSNITHAALYEDTDKGSYFTCFQNFIMEVFSKHSRGFVSNPSENLYA